MHKTQSRHWCHWMVSTSEKKNVICERKGRPFLKKLLQFISLLVNLIFLSKVPTTPQIRFIPMTCPPEENPLLSLSTYTWMYMDGYMKSRQWIETKRSSDHAYRYYAYECFNNHCNSTRWTSSIITYTTIWLLILLWTDINVEFALFSINSNTSDKKNSTLHDITFNASWCNYCNVRRRTLDEDVKGKTTKVEIDLHSFRYNIHLTI
jgi:hypothetical protein